MGFNILVTNKITTTVPNCSIDKIFAKTSWIINWSKILVATSIDVNDIPLNINLLKELILVKSIS